MRTVHTVAEVRTAVRGAHARGRTVGLVPTMGALHEGHLSLVRRAREECDEVIVSLFVNPIQFAPHEDLASYPRDPERDGLLAGDAGADLMFTPTVDDVYPDGFATVVSVRGVSEVLEGAERGRGHFDGVATVVTKLLNMVGPDVAFFGQKDAQQVAVLRRLVRDLDLPVRLEVCPTVRERDGLAMSSRNVYLSDSDRRRAVALSQGLAAAREALRDGERDGVALAERARATMAEHGVQPEYVALVDPDTFAPVSELTGPTLLAVAAQVGPARLIDNELLSPTPSPLQRKEQPCSA